MNRRTIVHSRDEDGPFAYIAPCPNVSPYTYCYILGERPPHYPVPAIRYNVFLDDYVLGRWFQDAGVGC
jgi:hypothetical protein